MKPVMRTIIITATLLAALLFVSASVWEGVSAVVTNNGLPGTYTIATNAFPRNTVVDVTNLENGKMVRVIVAAGHENAGLLAILSRDTANAIDLRPDSTCRIWITQPSDDIAFSRFRLGPITDNSVQADSGTHAQPQAQTQAVTQTQPQLPQDTTAEIIVLPEPYEIIAHNTTDAAVPGTFAEDAPAHSEHVAVLDEPATQASGNRLDSDGYSTGQSPDGRLDSDGYSTAQSPDGRLDSDGYSTGLLFDDRPDSDGSALAAVETGTPSEYYVFVPAENRPPAAPPTTPPAAPPEAQPYTIAAAPVAPPDPPAATAYRATPASAPFRAPLVSNLEQGKWYVQIGAYNQPDHVEDAISRIGTAYPLVVQNTGTDANPLFRILLGPLNQGESGAILQRFKSIGYTDAFMRRN